MKVLNYILPAIAIGVFSFAFENSPTLHIISGGQKSNIEFDQTYLVTDKTFDMVFEMKKGESVYVEIANLSDQTLYNQFLKTQKLSDLEGFQTGNAYSVSINTLSGIDDKLYLSDKARQSLVYEGRHFSSFSKADSNQTHYTLQYTVNGVSDFRFEKPKDYSLRKCPLDTLYCIARISVYNAAKVDSLTVPYKLVFSK